LHERSRWVRLGMGEVRKVEEEEKEDEDRENECR
jgi:hypothetical protein